MKKMALLSVCLLMVGCFESHDDPLYKHPINTPLAKISFETNITNGWIAITNYLKADGCSGSRRVGKLERNNRTITKLFAANREVAFNPHYYSSKGRVFHISSPIIKFKIKNKNEYKLKLKINESKKTMQWTALRKRNNKYSVISTKRYAMVRSATFNPEQSECPGNVVE